MTRLFLVLLGALVLLGGCRRTDPLTPEPGPLSWEPVGGGIRLEHLVSASDGLLAGLVVRDRRLLVVSEDRGRTWHTPWEPPAPFDSLTAVLAAGDDGALYVVGSTPLNPATGLRGHAVFRLTDGGTRSERLPTLWNTAAVTAIAASGGQLYLGTFGADEQGLSRSADGGRTWSRTPVRTARGGGLLASTLATDGGSRVAAQIVDGNVLSDLFLSADGGGRWRLAPHPSAPIRRLAFGRRGRLYAALDHPGRDGVYRSENNVASWTRLPLVVPQQRLLDLLVVPGDRLYAAAGFDGVFLSPDGGSTWQTANEGLLAADDDAAVDVLRLVRGADDHLYAVTRTGLFRSIEPVS